MSHKSRMYFFGQIIHKIVALTLYLLVSSADNLCKQFGPRSGPTKCRADLDSNCLTLWWCSWNIFLEKNQQMTKKHANLLSMQRVNKTLKWQIIMNMNFVLQANMGLIVDLTNTTRFYNSKKVEETGCRYVKMQCRG